MNTVDFDMRIELHVNETLTVCIHENVQTNTGINRRKLQ